MDSNKKRTTIAGSLYIVGTAAGVLSIAPAVDAPDYLFKAYANENQILQAALFQFLMTVAYTGFAITLYPLLRKHMESMALGFLTFRIIAAVLNIIGFIIILMILSLSHAFVIGGSPVSSYYQTIGDLLRSGRDFINHIAMIFAISIGGLLFYTILFQTKLLPRWMSVTGLAATLLTIAASLLVMFHVIEILTTIYLALNLPLIILETVLAIWLIMKGFNAEILNSVAEY